MKNITLLFFLSFCPLLAQVKKQDQLDAIFESLEATHKAMGGISIHKEGKEVYQKSFGYANVAQENKSIATTKYRIGSVTKMYTATIILQLIEEGKLQLDTPLSTFFPKLPNASSITIKNLLKHQSGLFNITEDEDFRTWMLLPQLRDNMLDRMVKNGVIFEPGTDTSYCNTNYILLGYIAEDITGQSFDDIIEASIITPLQLERTFVGVDSPKSKKEAVSYQWVNNQWEVVTEYTDMSAPGGAGAVVSTPSEVNMFTTALYTGRLISQASYQQMTDVSTGMGMGLGGGVIMDLQGYGMSGQIDGFKSLAIFLPEKEISITILCNAYESSLQEILLQVLEIYFKN